MGFFRQQEEKLARRLIVWQYERRQLEPPAGPTLQREAARVVADAHRIARQRGGNVLAILKDLVADIRTDLKNR